MNIYRNHLKIAFRNLVKNKVQSFILIGGLTIGMSACIMLLMYIGFELSYDSFHSKKDNIYRVINERFQNGSSIQKGTITYPTISYAMKEDFPEIKNATRISYSSDVIITHKNKVDPIAPALWVDEHFFEMFDFNLLAQDKPTVLDEVNEVILTKEIALKYFPAAKNNFQSIVGEEIKLDRYFDPFKIVGICDDVPVNSLLQFDILISYASLIRFTNGQAETSKTQSDYHHFIELEDGVDVAALQAKFSDFSTRHFNGTKESGSIEVFSLQALNEAHLYSISENLEYEIGKVANGKSVWSLLIIAFFILLIAWVNYINLSSVRALERAKEVGVRKVLGATQRQLVVQFISEAFIINLVSLLLAILIIYLSHPFINQTLGIYTSFSFFGNEILRYLMMGLIGFILVGILISGTYPTWLLTSQKVSNHLKNIFSNDLSAAKTRKVLVVFQFTVSIALITITWMVSEQIKYMSQQDIGINIDQIVTINSPEMTRFDSTFIDRMNTFKTELTKIPNVESASTSSRAPSDILGRIFQIQKIGEDASDQTFMSNSIFADFDFAKTYGLEPLAGRGIRKNDHNTDFSQIENLVITKAAAEMFGYQDVTQSIGKRIRFFNKDWTIVGVLPDFHQRSLHYPIEPIIFIPSYSPNNLLSLKMSSKNIDQTIAQVKTTYEEFFPKNNFEYSFLDEEFNQQYEADLSFKNVLLFFTLLTILIACLGLLGLASYTTYLRTKEIGIRKVLGAGTFSIINLISKDFLKLVFIALILATPLSYFVMKKWLEEFSYHIEMHWWSFLIAGLVALIIAFITVGSQSLKAAMNNPVDAIKSE